jgi:hypothetical protein
MGYGTREDFVELGGTAACFALVESASLSALALAPINAFMSPAFVTIGVPESALIKALCAACISLPTWSRLWAELRRLVLERSFDRRVMRLAALDPLMLLRPLLDRRPRHSELRVMLQLPEQHADTARLGEVAIDAKNRLALLELPSFSVGRM